VSRISSLGSVVGIQAAGSAATFLAVVLLGRQRGADIQGAFSLAKAEIDLLVALLLVGMPQAIFYHLHRRELNWAAVRRLAAVHAAAAGCMAAGFMWFRHAGTALGSTGLIAAAVAVLALVAHADLRGALLDARSSRVFSIVTALPGLCLLLAVVVVLGADGMTDRRWATVLPVVAAANAAAFGVAALVARGSGSDADPPRSPELTVLARYGGATWVSAVAQTLNPVLALGWIERQIGDPAGVGAFAAAALSMNVVLTPFAMLVPLLFKRWVGHEGAARWSEIRQFLWPTLLTCLAFAAVLRIFQVPLVSSVFGSDYLQHAVVFPVLAIGLWPQVMGRLLGVLFSAEGRPWLSILGDVSRVIVLAGVLLVFEVGNLASVAVAWVLAEFVALAIGYLVARGTAASTARVHR
jgi:O-antigen/teichoic acid export membrane protein